MSVSELSAREEANKYEVYKQQMFGRFRWQNLVKSSKYIEKSAPKSNFENFPIFIPLSHWYCVSIQNFRLTNQVSADFVPV